jgi:PAS domain S-box-containing protein
MMRGSESNKRKSVEQVRKPRAHKAKLEYVHHDVGENKETPEGLKDLYRSMMENVRVAVALIDLNYKILMVNNAMIKYFRKPACEFIGRECFREFEKRESICSHCPGKRAIATGQSAEVETEGVRDNGYRIPVRIQAFPTIGPDGAVTGFIEIIEDITERKKAKEQLLDYQAQLKSLASQLTLTEEREKHHLATELHSRIGQSLAISKLKIDILRTSGLIESVAKDLKEVSDLLGKTISETRKLTFDLSSPILHELGFESAVAAWLNEEIEQKYSIAVELETDKKPTPLGNDTKTLLFRDVRELLINVVKHSRATKVKVSIRRIGDRISVCVEDNGIGFNPAEVAAKSAKEGGFGLFSIRQGLEQSGGLLEIESAPDCGCKITMLAPLEKEKNTKGA